MYNSNKLGASVGKASPSPKADLSFFNQIVGGPNPLNPREMVIQVVPGTGISARDYFAAHALAFKLNDAEALNISSVDLAHWAYCVADAMIAERSRVQGKANDSQFHEDHMK